MTKVTKKFYALKFGGKFADDDSLIDGVPLLFSKKSIAKANAFEGDVVVKVKVTIEEIES